MPRYRLKHLSQAVDDAADGKLARILSDFRARVEESAYYLAARAATRSRFVTGRWPRFAWVTMDPGVAIGSVTLVADAGDDLPELPATAWTFDMSRLRNG